MDLQQLLWLEGWIIVEIIASLGFEILVENMYFVQHMYTETL